MKRSMHGVSVALFVMAVAMTVPAEEKTIEKMALDKIPSGAIDAAKKALQGFEVKGGEKEPVAGKTNYKLEGTVGAKDAVVVVSADNRVLMMEQGLELKYVPVAVTAAAIETVTGFVADKAMKGTDGQVTFFVLNGKAESKSYILRVTLDGKVLEVKEAIEVKSVPQAVTATAVKIVQDFTTVTAQKITQGVTVAFDLQGKVLDKPYELVINSEGKLISLITIVEIKADEGETTGKANIIKSGRKGGGKRGK